MLFQSRRDKAISIIYLIVVLLGFFLLIYSVLNIVEGNGELFLSIFNGLVGLVASFLIIVIYANTYYELRGKFLFVRSGPFTDEIRYNQIERIEKVRSFTFGAALARERFRLYCGKRKNGRPNIVQISPERPDEFLKKLSKYAPHIEIN